MNPRFYFACCQFGAEKAVKAEVLERHPQLRFAFSRPGFITFKEDSDQKAAIQKAPGIFTRHWGQSLGQAKDIPAFVALLNTIPVGSIVHFFERDTFVPGDDPLDFVAGARIASMQAQAFATDPALESRFQINAVPAKGQKVYDVIWLDEFHAFLGQHIQGEGLDPAPGNQPKIDLPVKSPSRAYLKLAEAIHRFQISVKPGMSAIEVGCSPGGATSLMLDREMFVLGVDPKEMSPGIYDYPKFKFVQKMAKLVTPADLAQFNPDWVVMDMNIAPLEALDELAHIVRTLHKNYGNKLAVKRGFITLKLNDWKFAQSIPLYLKRIEEMGFRDLVPMQLASNRQEFFVMARSFR